MKRGLRVWTRTIIGGLVVLLMVAVAGCADAEPKPESTEGRPWGQPLKKLEGAPVNLG